MVSPSLVVLLVSMATDTRLILRQLLARATAPGYTLIEVERADLALAALQIASPDCVLLDLHLPDQALPDLLAALRTLGAVPVILIARADSEDLAVECLQYGAEDYLLLDGLSPLRLHASIQRVVNSARRDKTHAYVEADLRASEGRYRMLFEAMDKGFGVCELVRDGQGQVVDYRFIHFNRALEALTGLVPAETIGRLASEVLVGLEGLDQGWLRTFRHVVEAGEPTRFEQYAEPFDRWYDVTAFPYGGDQFAVLYDDISVRKRAEERIRAVAEFNAFWISLSDALRPLSDPLKIQIAACRLLGEHLGVNRVNYADVEAETFVVRSEYVRGVAPFLGSGRITDFGSAFLELYQRGEMAVVCDVSGDPRFTDAERSALQAIDIAAFVGVMLVKDGTWVGCFGAHSAMPRVWSSEDLVLIEGVGQRIWSMAQRARAEAALRESELRFRTVAELSPDGILINQDNCFIYANPAAARIYGVASPSDLVGIRPLDIVAPEHYERKRLRIEQVLAGEMVPWIDLEIIRPDGSRVTVDVSAARILWDGAPAVEVLWRPSAKRQAHESAMRRIESLFRAVQETAFDGLMLFESVRDSVGTIVDFRWLYANAAAEQIISRPRGWCPGRLMLEELPENRSTGLFQSYVQVVETGVPWTTEIVYNDDGIDAYARLAAAKVEDGFVVSITDLTERRLAEERLRESELRFRTVAELSPDGLLVHQDGRLVYANSAAARIYGLANPSDLVGLGPLDIVAPECLESVQANIEQALQGQQAAWFEVDLIRPGGSRVTIEANAAQITWDGAAAIEVLWHDVTRRKRSEATLRESEAQVRLALAAEQAARQAAEAASERTARLQALTAALAGTLSQEAVVRVMTGYGIVATRAITATVSVLTPSGKIEQVGWAGYGPDAPATFQGIPPNTRGLMAEVIQRGEAIWLGSQAEAENLFRGSSQVMAQVGCQAYVTLPLQVADQVIGAIGFGYAEPNVFSPEDRAFMLALAQQCAQALDRARLYREVVESQARLQHLSERLIAVQEEERRHLARELHDEIGQSLSALNLMLSMSSTQPPDALLAQLALAQRQVGGLISLVRQRSLDLRPSMLDDMGLHPALAWYLTRYSEQTGIKLDTEIQGIEDRFPPLVELTAYRIVQEALTNVARHAGVDHATVLVWTVDEQLMIEVSDTGRGFDPDLVRRAYASNGLVGMRERAVLLGGELVIESEPGGGTRLFAALPLAQPATTREGGAP
jgi:PAS domain S-box-containing protein